MTFGLQFFKAFRSAESSHALVQVDGHAHVAVVCLDSCLQCVEIMSDDQSTLLKRQGVIEVKTFPSLPPVHYKN